MPARLRMAFLIFVGVSLPLCAFGQWTRQTIHLQPGWNAVFFEVEPAQRDCSVVFKGIPVESVWGWNRRFVSIQFVKDPGQLLPEEPDWVTYFPPSSPQAFLTKLLIIQGGRPYLVKLGGAQPVDLVLTGRPKNRTIQWISDSYNLVGSHVDSVAPPTFAAYFAPSAAHAGQDVFRLGADGRWQKVAGPATDKMRRGEAFWVYCKGPSDYQGPLNVIPSVGDGLDYARLLIEQSLTLKNLSASGRTITFRLKASDPPPTTTLPALAGAVPLACFENDLPHQKYGWTALPSPYSLALGSGGELNFSLAVRRPAMVAYTPPAGREALYQSLLEVSDGAGSFLVLPVSAQGMSAPLVTTPSGGSPSPGSARPNGGSSPASRAGSTALAAGRIGLWVGHATITAVSNPTSGSLDPKRPLPTATPFVFRLVIHVDSSGQARLLQQVLEMWKEGAWIPNPNDPTSATYVLDPNSLGRTVLLTDDSLIPQFSGVALRDVKMVGRRISSAAFGFKAPIAMGGGEFGNPAAAPTTVSVVLDYQDPTNPFKHKYNPDHNNLDERFEQVLPEGVESYTAIRNISLQFTSQDPDDLVSAAWGDTELGGIYSEHLLGVHRSAVYVKGTFRLQRIADTPVLNDGLK